jgi:hypothetical protein
MWSTQSRRIDPMILCVPRTSSGVLKVKSGNIGGEGRQERGAL